MKLLLVFCLLITGFTQVSAQERFLEPFDDAKNNASFVASRDKLIVAVKKRDSKYLLSILDPKIANSFGGDGGIREFQESWKLNSPNSMVWDELLKVLTNGGKMSETDGVSLFSAPYSFDGFPEDLDAFENHVIFGKGVNLRSRPNLTAEVVAVLSYNIVKIDSQNSVENPENQGEYVWYKVETLGGKKGFVSAKFVRSPIDYRAIFEKRNGRWKMAAFIAGD